MADFKIKPCTFSDAHSIASTMQTAFWTDSQWIRLWHPHPLDFAIQQASLREPWNLLRTCHHRRHEKAIDAASGEMVGYARWTLPEIAGAEDLWSEAMVAVVDVEQREKAEREFQEADWPPFGPPRKQDDAQVDPISEARSRLMRGKTDLAYRIEVLDQLVVLPTARDRGIGTALVSSGLQQAQKLGLDVFVHSKKSAVGVYRRLGFKLLEQVIVPSLLAERGVEEEFAAFMLWEVNRRGGDV